MPRRTAHFAAAVAAAAVAAAQLAGLDVLVSTTRSPADPVVVLPRVVVTPSGVVLASEVDVAPAAEPVTRVTLWAERRDP